MAKRVSDDLNGLASELDTLIAQSLGKAALDVKKLMLDNARRYTGGDLRLSGVGRKGAKLNVRYDQQRGSRGKAVRIRAVGQWQFIETDRTGGYAIPKAKRGRRNPDKRLHTGHGKRGWVTGPIKGGRKSGAHVWKRTEPRAIDQVGDLFVKGFADVVRKA